MNDSSLVVRMLGPADAAVLDNVAPGVFDEEIDAGLTREFLADPRHHIAVALQQGRVVGFASAVHYLHPDKPAELFVNEVGVAAAHQRQGIGRRLMAVLLAHGKALGCRQAWVGTGRDNAAARALYKSAGATEDPEPFVLAWFDL